MGLAVLHSWEGEIPGSSEMGHCLLGSSSIDEVAVFDGERTWGWRTAQHSASGKRLFRQSQDHHCLALSCLYVLCNQERGQLSSRAALLPSEPSSSPVTFVLFSYLSMSSLFLCQQRGCGLGTPAWSSGQDTMLGIFKCCFI